MEKITNRQIVYSAITCTSCNTTLVSHHRRDFKQCNCDNAVTIDGGVTDPKYSAVDFSNTYAHIVYADDPFLVVRRYAARGSKGKDGSWPLKWIALCEMTNAHLEAVIAFGGAAWHLELISKELQYRRENNILIEE